MLYFEQNTLREMEALSTLEELDYQIILDLFEHKSITRVAQMHFLSQPAITKRLRKIEQTLGCTLMIRTNKGVLFNAVGESILPYCKAMLRQSEALKNTVNARQGVVGGTLNIIASPNYCRYRLPSALISFAKAYPEVSINLTTGKSKDIHLILLQREDCVVITRGEHHWEGCRTRLSSEPMCLVYSRTQAGRPLNTYNYIYHNTDVKAVSLTEQWATENNISLSHSNLKVDDISTCKDLVQSGMGWSILPRICLDDFQGVIEPLTLKDGTPFVRNSYALYHAAYYELQQVKLFLDALIENERLHNLILSRNYHNV